jgi:hypothetical protein
VNWNLWDRTGLGPVWARRKKVGQMFLYGLSSLVFWILLVMAVFAVMRWSALGPRPHPYQG